MKIVVIGGSGPIGTKLVNTLREGGDDALMQPIAAASAEGDKR